MSDARRMGVPITMRSIFHNQRCTAHGRTAINAFIIGQCVHMHGAWAYRYQCVHHQKIAHTCTARGRPRRGGSAVVTAVPPLRCAGEAGAKNTRSPFGGGAVGSGWVTFWLWYTPLPVRPFRYRSIARSLSCVRMICHLVRGRYGCYDLL